ncbi:hypothetical protein CDD81_1671 [Ophiocordyceps australis]|uniref:Uncharacterized protein n=1 Tax=Ophiocordyceps australis TaxID=1399860 RepID=A0A2C5XVE7_9HYPO|nr:hypothetical protein CDD81_1671 [Ophiocordyceps australis]
MFARRIPALRASLRLGASRRTVSTARERIERLAAKMPESVKRYTAKMRQYPGSYITAFLILHEVTAVVPLVLLVLLFHYTTIMPMEYLMDKTQKRLKESMASFERYFRRKEYFGFKANEDASSNEDESQQEAMERWRQGDPMYRILVETALAWAITKLLLPVRAIVTIEATPWFAGVLIKAKKLFKR